MEQGNRKTKWLVYTVMIGLIPILTRLMAWAVTKKGVVDIFSASDVIAFGLILQISNINEIEHIADPGRKWKTTQNGTSITLISLYCVLYTLVLIGSSVIETVALVVCAIALITASLLTSHSVLDKISASENQQMGEPE
ncbi:hypothetical protein [Stenotrophomonas sp.]|uniref:hypothetical protein n=1 Tax=Stenotrophomonas sp. TaxID=69392 RepID=UPI0028B22A20|nr:hypothetical protein [Stenotrophomonas sp.]